MSYSPFPPAYAAPGTAVPADVLAVAGSDGTDARALLTDDTGQLVTANCGSWSWAPAITSPASITFTVGTLGSFTVTTRAVPTAALSKTGSLPSGVTFVDNGDGTATLAGTPGAGTAGSYPLTITASNTPGPNATQSFVLTVAS